MAFEPRHGGQRGGERGLGIPSCAEAGGRAAETGRGPVPRKSLDHGPVGHLDGLHARLRLPAWRHGRDTPWTAGARSGAAGCRCRHTNALAVLRRRISLAGVAFAARPGPALWRGVRRAVLHFGSVLPAGVDRQFAALRLADRIVDRRSGADRAARTACHQANTAVRPGAKPCGAGRAGNALAARCAQPALARQLRRRGCRWRWLSSRWRYMRGCPQMFPT